MWNEVEVMTRCCVTRRFRLPTLSVLLALLGAPACEGTRTDPAGSSVTNNAVFAQEAITPDPNTTYFTKVIANGTGCPKGSWNARISDDGLVFTATFSAYVAELSPNVSMAVQNCQLAIGLHTPAGRSFSVASMYFSGYALLEPGVVGRQTASYYFQGKPVEAKNGRNDTIGPYDADFVFQDDVEIQDAVWSPCGLERDLTVNTRIVLQNTTVPGGSGYMNLASADGTALIVKFSSRSCDDAGVGVSRTEG
jgi:hypothetical protein